MIDVTDTGDPRDRGEPSAAIASSPAPKPAAHQAAVARLQAAYAAIPPGRPIRLAKRTSNLFRFREAAVARTDPGDGAGTGVARRAAPPAWTCPRSGECSASTRSPGPRSPAG